MNILTVSFSSLYSWRKFWNKKKFMPETLLIRHQRCLRRHCSESAVSQTLLMQAQKCPKKSAKGDTMWCRIIGVSETMYTQYWFQISSVWDRAEDLYSSFNVVLHRWNFFLIYKNVKLNSKKIKSMTGVHTGQFMKKNTGQKSRAPLPVTYSWFTNVPVPVNYYFSLSIINYLQIPHKPPTENHYWADSWPITFLGSGIISHIQLVQG